jgi:hypothetical protein
MVRTAWIASLALAGCGARSAPAPTSSPPAVDTGFWDVLAAPESRWVLHDSMAEDSPPPELEIRVADVRRVRDARVVRLAGTVRYQPDSEPEAVTGSQSLDGAQWAIAPHGLWMLGAEDSDAAIATALAAPPHWASPPVELDPPSGRYSHLIRHEGETIACIGEVPDLGGEDCPDVCGGGMCIAARGGIVQLDAQWAPDPYAIYEQDAYRRAGAK